MGDIDDWYNYYDRSGNGWRCGPGSGSGVLTILLIVLLVIVLFFTPIGAEIRSLIEHGGTTVRLPAPH